MKRYEYDILVRLVVKAENQEQANEVVAKKWGTNSFESGRIIREKPWFQLPDEEVIEAPESYLPSAVVEAARSPKHLKRASRVSVTRTVNRLKEFLDKTQVSKHVVARRMGINSASLYSWLSGKWKPGHESIKKINAFLDQEEG
jgi:DNA-binding transcriptional regulator YiaG